MIKDIIIVVLVLIGILSIIAKYTMSNKRYFYVTYQTGQNDIGYIVLCRDRYVNLNELKECIVYNLIKEITADKVLITNIIELNKQDYNILIKGHERAKTD